MHCHILSVLSFIKQNLTFRFRYSTTARISDWRTIVYSSPSIFTSVPLYFAAITRSPSFRYIFTSLPSTSPPGPTAITLAIWGFSTALAAKTIPLFVVSSASSALSRTLSESGLIVITHTLRPVCFWFYRANPFSPTLYCFRTPRGRMLKPHGYSVRKRKITRYLPKTTDL